MPRIYLAIGVFLILVLGQYAAYAQVSGEELHTLVELEKNIVEGEQLVVGIKPHNEARIIWAHDTIAKTPLVFLYLHGFGASNREGEPVIDLLSQKYGANVYMSRLCEHGINRENAYEELTKEKYIQSAEKALQYARQLGDEVIVVGTSTGGSLGLYLAGKYPDIKGLILYSPFIDLFDSAPRIVNSAVGPAIFYLKNWGWTQMVPRDEIVGQYWSEIYHLNGYLALFDLIDSCMTEEYFQKVKCPVMMGYYYRDEEHQDHVVSVKAMQTMFDELGTDSQLKKKVAFPLAGNHVIACDLRSNDWQAVYNTTVDFMNHTILNKQ